MQQKRNAINVASLILKHQSVMPLTIYKKNLKPSFQQRNALPETE
jgi:hypothetical protein